MSFSPWPRPKPALLGLLLLTLGISSVQPTLAALPAPTGGDRFAPASAPIAGVTADYARAMESLGYHQLAPDELAVRQVSQGAHTGQQKVVAVQ